MPHHQTHTRPHPLSIELKARDAVKRPYCSGLRGGGKILLKFASNFGLLFKFIARIDHLGD
jgi:hypothetical protein